MLLSLFRCTCMSINISVHHNGGFLPDIILLTHLIYSPDLPPYSLVLVLGEFVSMVLYNAIYVVLYFVCDLPAHLFQAHIYRPPKAPHSRIRPVNADTFDHASEIPFGLS